jgi:hypothetical protein
MDWHNDTSSCNAPFALLFYYCAKNEAAPPRHGHNHAADGAALYLFGYSVDFE